jgi:hypothetical protein
VYTVLAGLLGAGLVRLAGPALGPRGQHKPAAQVEMAAARPE